MTAPGRWPARLRARALRLYEQALAGGPVVAWSGYALVLLAALAVASWPQFSHAEWKLYDVGMRWLREHAPRPAAIDVVVIAADEATFAAFDEPLALWHRRLARLIEAMVLAQPRVLGLDIVLPAKSYEAVVPGIDRDLMRALLLARGRLPVVLGQSVDDQFQPRPLFPGFAGLAGPQQVGSVLLCMDDDGVVRRVMPGRCGGEGTPEGLAQRMAAALQAPERGTGLIDYRIGGLMPTVSMAQVLAWHAAGDHEQLRRTFAGKAVLLGLALPLEDRLGASTPLWQDEPGLHRVPGVMVHAQILRSLATNGYLPHLPRSLDLLATALVCGLWFVRGAWRTLLYGASFVLLPLGGLYLLWLGFASSPALLLLAAQLAVAARRTLEGLADAHERRRLQRAFAGHVSPAQLRLLARRPDTAPTRLETAAVLHLSLQPQTADAADWPALAAHHARFRDQVQRHGGLVERLSGTEAVACFGLPLPCPDPARRALETALALRRAAAAEPLPGWLAGLGLALGPLEGGFARLPGAEPWLVLGHTLGQARQAASAALHDGAQPLPVRVCPRLAAAVQGQGLAAVPGDESLRLTKE